MSNERDVAFSELSNAMSMFSRISPTRYWSDLLLSAGLGWSGLWISALSDSFGVAASAFFIAVVFLYRATAFIHEVVHVQRKLPFFRRAYDFIIGFANCYPSYIYEPHFYHHLTRCYGTKDDPEYNSLEGRGKLRVLLSPVLLSFVLPIYQTFRFVFLPFLYPFLGSEKMRFIYERMSTLVFNAEYRRPHVSDEALSEMVRSDLACASYRIGAFALTSLNILPLRFIVLWYCTIVLGSIMNMYRALANHDYSRPFERRSRFEQFLQSKTLSPHPINEIWAPLAMGYHALHHLSPAIPYHELPNAHRYIMNKPSIAWLYLETMRGGTQVSAVNEPSPQPERLCRRDPLLYPTAIQ
jgi:fatty acid desaturase